MLGDKIERQHMNRIGLTFIAVIVLQYVVCFASYFIFALATGTTIPFHSALPQDLLKTLAEVQTSLKVTPYPYVVTLIATTLIAEILPAFFIAKRVGIVPSVEFFGSSKVGASKIALFGVCGIAGSAIAGLFTTVITAILKLFKIKVLSPKIEIPWDQPPAAILMLLTVVLLAPFAEEFLCRGVFLSVFKRFGVIFGIVGSSLLWALLHGNIVQGIPVFVMGLFFGLITIKADSIWPSFILHSLNNMLAVIQMSMQKQGNIGIIGAAAITWAILILGVVLFSCFYKKFEVKKCAGDGYGFKTFFTSPSIIIGIVAMLALTARTFVIA